MRSMQWQLGMLRTISAFVYRHRETKKNLCRDGRSQDLPNTEFQPAVQHLKLKQQYTHGTANTHNMTIHTRQLQQYIQLQQYTLYNKYNTHKTNTTIHKKQIQQYIQDKYSNTHKTTTTIHAIQLQKYLQYTYNNTHKTTTTIRTRQLTTTHARHLTIQPVQKVNNTR